MFVQRGCRESPFAEIFHTWVHKTEKLDFILKSALLYARDQPSRGPVASLNVYPQQQNSIVSRRLGKRTNRPTVCVNADQLSLHDAYRWQGCIWKLFPWSLKIFSENIYFLQYLDLYNKKITWAKLIIETQGLLCSILMFWILFVAYV